MSTNDSITQSPCSCMGSMLTKSNSSSDFSDYSDDSDIELVAIIPQPQNGGKGKEKMVPVTSHSNIAESIVFLDAIFGNPAFFQTLTAQEILKNKCVSRSWAAWTNDNIININVDNARRQDQGHDWYFPVFGTKDFEVNWHGRRIPRVQFPRTFYGMWHATAEYSATTELRKLPPLGYLPILYTLDLCSCERNVKSVVKASAGGLLLIETAVELWLWAGLRHGPYNHDQDCKIKHSTWPSLMVTNPLTKSFNILPKYNGEPGDRWLHSSPQFHMMVDEDANNYKVVVYYSSNRSRIRSQLVVYDSKSMVWEGVEGQVHSPLQPSLGCWTEPPIGINTIYATTLARGHLYLADLQKPNDTQSQRDPLLTGVVRLFQVDIETGQRFMCTKLPLCKTYNTSVQIDGVHGDDAFEAGRILRNLELVECMGHLYAVIPARLDEFLYRPKSIRHSIWEDVPSTTSLKFMPLQFYIFQLDGDIFQLERGVGDGVLRIEIPTTSTRKNADKVMRGRSLLKKTWVSLQDNQGKWTVGQNWFSCTARGSVIWVTLEDYLLQYDVLSGKSTTEILPLDKIPPLGRDLEDFGVDQIAGVAYRVNFHMKA